MHDLNDSIVQQYLPMRKTEELAKNWRFAATHLLSCFVHCLFGYIFINREALHLIGSNRMTIGMMSPKRI
jgi:hypothetical protein